MRRLLWLAIVGNVAACGGASSSSGTVTFTLSGQVDAGKESLSCKFVLMPTGDHYVVGASHMYTPGSHHMLLYRTDLSTLAPGMDQVQDCYEGGGGTIMSHVRGVLYGSQEPTGEMTLPDGVGFHLASQEVLLLQAHYLNATEAPLSAEVTVHLSTLTDASKIHEQAGTLFYYDPFIDVPADSTAQASGRCTLPQDIHLLSVFPHYHARGVSYEAYLDMPGQAPATDPFYTSTDYNHPATWTGGPQTLGAGTKIRYYCDYDNSGGSQEYLQGQSAADNEMCMFTGMYYPAMDQAGERCEKSFDMFGTGTANCAATANCLSACPTGTAPRHLTDLDTDGAVDPCWQRCIVQSCPSSSTPLFAQLDCIAAHCLNQCGQGADACRSCVTSQCLSVALACQADSCGAP